jgi:hypothetical protein
VGHAQLFGLALLLVALTFVVRLFFPAGHEWHHLQLAFFPQYVVLFVLGTMAERRRWLEALTSRLVPVWTSILGAVFVVVIGLVIVLLPRGPAALVPFVGGAHLEALALDVLESLYCVGASVTAIVVFRARFGDSAWAKALTPDAYAVYVLHAPVIVAIAFASRGLALGPWIKFGLLTAMGTAACFALSHFALRRFALVRRVL